MRATVSTIHRETISVESCPDRDGRPLLVISGRKAGADVTEFYFNADGARRLLDACRVIAHQFPGGTDPKQHPNPKRHQVKGKIR